MLTGPYVGLRPHHCAVFIAYQRKAALQNTLMAKSLRQPPDGPQLLIAACEPGAKGAFRPLH